jgi:DNA-directed RNA polymerase II subunit RPB1
MNIAAKQKIPVHISAVSFGLFGPDEIEKESVVQVTETSIYQKNVPREGGVADHRMGPGDRRIPCGTCKQDVQGCNGHFGHIVLPIPCYNSFLLVPTLKLLRSVCFFCSRLLITTHLVDPDSGKRRRNPKVSAILRRTEGMNRFQQITKLARTKSVCSHCEATQPTYTKHVSQKTFAIDMQWSEDAMKQWDPPTEEDVADAKQREQETQKRQEERNMATKPFTSIDAYNILKHMHRDDIELLGMNPDNMHPKKFMITVLKVPPPVIRPSVVASEGSRSRGQNDLTKKLLEIVKQCHIFNNVMKTHEGVFEKNEPLPKDVVYAFTELQYHVATYMINPIRGLKVAAIRSGAPLKGLQQRIKGKGGRIRGNLTGKRVDFSSRTVVSPDPNLEIDQVGVPKRIAAILTIEERVTPYNMAKLQQRILVGAKNHMGAHTVIIPVETGVTKTVYLEFVKPEERQRMRIECGWIVERYLQDNDYVIFNRQPSLHKKSLMAHRVKIMPEGDTFRLNLSVTQPYNADFDGTTFPRWLRLLQFN